MNHCSRWFGGGFQSILLLKSYLASFCLSYRILPVLFLLLDGPDLAMTLNVIPKQMKLNCEEKSDLIKSQAIYAYPCEKDTILQIS